MCQNDIEAMDIEFRASIEIEEDARDVRFYP